MYTWLILVCLAGTCGFLLARLVKRQQGVLLAAALPWLGLLAYLLHNEYVTQFQDEGLSMWLLAQAFVGPVATCFGVVAFMVTRSIQPFFDSP